MKLIHFTDTHLVKPGETLYGLDPRARLEACIADINRHHRDAELCVITGDLVHHGAPAAYTVLRECLSRLEIPVRLVIGNHDDRASLLAVFPEVATDPAGFVQSTADTSAGRCLFLDTIDTGHHTGRYCERRIDWLQAQLDTARDRPVYLFMHHPPFPIGLKTLDDYGLQGAEPLAAAVRPHANIRHLFFGHVHRPVSGHWQGISFSTLRATAHQFWLDFASRELPVSHEPPAYAVVFIEDDRLIVHTHDYLYDGPVLSLF